MTGIPLLATEGDAHACGLAHGRRFAREIADNVETYLRRFAASGLDRDGAFAEGERWLDAMAGQNAAYAEEMQGIARGSEQSDASIALLNARYELAFTLFGNEAKRQELLAVGPDGCTTFGLVWSKNRNCRKGWGFIHSQRSSDQSHPLRLLARSDSMGERLERIACTFRDQLSLRPGKLQKPSRPWSLIPLATHARAPFA
jgi:hypothetical protein